MRFHNGSNRFVAVIPRLGIVIKFPKVHLRRFLKSTSYYLRHGYFKRMWNLKVDDGELKWSLFKGLSDNWNEFLAYWNSAEKAVLEPTYLSLFGLLNIQRAGADIPESENNRRLWTVFASVCTEAEMDLLFKDPHHFSNDDNFCIADGKLKIRDYGSVQTREIIRKLGLEFFDKVSTKYMQDSANNTALP